MELKDIDAKVFSVLCDPDARHPLEWDDGNLRNAVTGRVYPIREGIPLFVSTVSGSSLHLMRIYNRVAGIYDLMQSFSRWRTRGPDHRKEAIEELDLQPGMRMLEIGVGTGAVIPYVPKDVEYFGLDISFNMLRKCQKNLDTWGRKAHLFQGEARKLPFRVEAFDRVLHVGGINRFSHPARALREMAWVAKPGAKIVIVDRIEIGLSVDPETEPVNELAGPADPRPGTELLSMLPPEITDIKTQTMGGGKWYCITLYKPELHGGEV